ncbi:MAG: AAA family ATPase [Acidobacteria bacterium]|nr:AAA family ATPase [Acidobacteriota bacterium]
MYETFYGFKEKPFALTPDPRYFYPSRAHREAIDHLLYGIREREGFIVITGGVGTGKTTLCRAMLLQIEPETTTAVIFNPILSEDELLQAVLLDFGLTAAGRTKNELIAELNTFLLRTAVAGRRAVLIIDEAQNLSHALLEQIRLLSNLETERNKLIQIILVGQAGLLKQLASPELEQLNQRVSVRYHLNALTFPETCQYVYHRLMVAGGTAGVSMSSGALRAIHKYSRGIPRLINLAADRALLQSFADQSRDVTRRRAAAGIKSLTGESDPKRTLRPSIRALMAVLAGAILIAAAAAGWLLTSARAGEPRVPPARQTSSSASAPAALPFAVLVGTFATEPEAREVEQRLADRGAYTTVVARQAEAQRPGGYSVLVGRFQDVNQAEQARHQLAGEGGFADARVVRTVEGAGSQQ